VLTELTHLPEILQVLPSSMATTVTMAMTTGSSTSSSRGMEFLLVYVWSRLSLVRVFAPPIFVPELIR
jgi:hypothetical protein